MRNAKSNPGKTALVFGEENLNWKELRHRVEAASAALEKKFDSNEQEIAALLLTNSTEFVVVYLAVLHLGHIAFPMDPAYKKLELDAIVNEISPRLIITDTNYRRQIGEHQIPIIMVEELQRAKGRPEKLARSAPKEQVASLTFTSGTTGVPKAVPNTHANHIWNIETCSKVWGWTADDTLLVGVPLSHMLGIVMALSGALYHGNTMYILDQRFDAQKTLEFLSSGKVSFYSHISIIYQKLLESGGDYDLSPVRLCVSGGAPLPPEIWRQFKKRFGIEILETYGSSETGRIAANRLGDKPMLGSPGRFLPGVDAKLSKDNEVLVKSRGVFPGYFNNAEATRKAFTKDGYFKTGDIGELRDGYLFLKGRVAERIRRFGNTVSPRDVEWAMHQHPKIKDIYVLGRQKPGQPNDELVYFVVGELNENEIRDYCKTNLFFAWRPDKIIFLDNLPRTGSGKPRAVEFRRLAEAHR